MFRFPLGPIILLILSWNLHAKSVVAPTQLEVMSFNVENLFDTEHDFEAGKEKDDWTYLPKDFPGKKEACAQVTSDYYREECLQSDWTDKKLKIKLKQIEKVLTRGRKSIPDFLALIEVENANVVGKLAKKVGYDAFEITTSPDKRGIDVALLYKKSSALQKVAMREHALTGEYFEKKPTRNILEVEFMVANKYPLTVFVNHWPSLSNPTSTRLIAAQTLYNRIEEILKTNPGQHILALGDFNTIPSNAPHPFDTVLLKDGLLKDLHDTYSKDRSISLDIKRKMAPGTYFYPRNMTWDLLDRAFYNANLLDGKGLDLDVASYNVYTPKFMTKTYRYTDPKDYFYGTRVKRTPKKYRPEETLPLYVGYSDHFPVIFNLIFK